MRFPRTSAVALLILAGFAGCRLKPHAPRPAPLFELKDLSGKTVSLASFKGHPVLLDFWATWCGPCQISIPLVQKFYAAHKDQGLVVLGMNVDDDPANVYAFAKHFNITYPILYAGNTPASDSYEIEGIPTFVFIDQQGRLVKRFDGFRPDMPEEWEYELQRLTSAPAQ